MGRGVLACLLALIPVASFAQSFLASLAAFDRGFPDALAHRIPPAEQGDAGKQNNLGNLYSAGLGVDHDAIDACAGLAAPPNRIIRAHRTICDDCFNSGSGSTSSIRRQNAGIGWRQNRVFPTPGAISV